MNTPTRLSSPDTCSGRLQRAAYELLLEHHQAGEIPTNGRFLFYELVGRGIVHKIDPPKRRGTKDRPGALELSEATMVLRELGLIPWNWIVDETRTLHEWNHSTSIVQYMRDRLELARINPWNGEPPLLLVESRSLGGVLRHHMSEYLVPIAATNGQVGGFLHTDIVPLLRNRERPVLYLGDLDLQGEQIEANTLEVLERECDQSIDWTRIALTRTQVEEQGLTPLIKKDNRYRPARTHSAWECEALGQRFLVDLVRDALDALLPRSLDAVQAQEEDERAELENMMDDRFGEGP